VLEGGKGSGDGERASSAPAQHLGRDPLHALPSRQLLARHAPHQLARPEPHRVDDRSTTHLHGLAPLLVGIVRVAQRDTRLDRAAIDRPHLARERVRADPMGVRHPARLVLRPGHASHQANLRPRERARQQGLLEPGEPRQTPVDAGEILEGASGEPYPLDPVVTQTRKAERLPGASSHELARNGRERAPHRPARPTEPHETPLDTPQPRPQREMGAATRTRANARRHRPPTSPTGTRTGVGAS
jgi:hypothetical protein